MWIIYHQNHTNYQIVKIKKLLHRDSLGRNQKEKQKSTRMAEEFTGCEIDKGLLPSSLFASHSALYLLVLLLYVPIDFFMLELHPYLQY